MIEDFISKNKLPNYRLDQFNKAYYKDLISDFSEITTWPIPLREKLAEEFEFSTIEKVTELISIDKSTKKILFKRKSDGKQFETVLMKHKNNRYTVCVSCMIGCPVGCTFCATGKLGFSGNLTSREIVDQVLYFSRSLKRKDKKITNIVFMGMGEPMLNLAEVQKAISTFIDDDKMALGKRRITISTSGYVPQLEKLIKDGFRGRIAISLHAPNQALREELMPVAKIYSLDKLFALLDNFVALTNKRVSYEFVMIKDVNDSKDNALELANFLKDRLSHVNLIPYNRVDGLNYRTSDKESIENFVSILEKYKIPCTVRRTMGDDIAAACGQLANKNSENGSK